MLKIRRSHDRLRRSHDRLIFNMGIPIPGKDGLYIETRPCRFNLWVPNLQMILQWLYFKIAHCDCGPSNSCSGIMLISRFCVVLWGCSILSLWCLCWPSVCLCRLRWQWELAQRLVILPLLVDESRTKPNPNLQSACVTYVVLGNNWSGIQWTIIACKK